MGKLSYDTIITASVSDDQSKLSAESGQTVFGELAESTAGQSDRSVWENGLRQFEDKYMDEYFGAEPAAKKANGDYKYRTYLPKAWVSGKCVCGQAITLNIPINENSAKTDTELKIKEAKALLDPKSAKQKFGDVMGTARKLYFQLHANAKRNIDRDFGLDMTASFWSGDDE